MFGEDFTPNNVCRSCYNHILSWSRGEKIPHMLYLTPAIWTNDPDGHDPMTCYACRNFKVAISRSRHKVYQSTLIGLIPVAYDQNVLPPNPSTKEMMSEFSGIGTVTSGGPSSSVAEFLDPSFVDESEEDEAEFLTQDDMDFLVAKGRMY